MTESNFAPRVAVQVSNVFSFASGSVSTLENAGSFEANTIIREWLRRSRAATNEVLSDVPSAVVASAEQGASSATSNFSQSALVAGRIAAGAAIVGGLNDARGEGLRGQHAEHLCQQGDCAEH